MIISKIGIREAFDHDVCVIGAGHAGLTLALQLSRAGKRVLLFESGYDHVASDVQKLALAELPDPKRHDSMEVATSRRLGGTSNLWGARCQPFDPVDFERDRPFAKRHWPISYDDILPYYEQACRLVDAGAPVFTAPIEGYNLPQDEFEYTRLERYSRTPQMQRLHRREIVSSENIKIYLGCTLNDILHDNGSVVAIEIKVKGGRVLRVGVSKLVLACGGVEVTRLLLSMQARSGSLFGGPCGPLGKNYMGHVIGEVADITWKSRVLDENTDYYIDEYDTYVRRRLTPTRKTQYENALPNICFWTVAPPFSDHRHKSGILSLGFLALSIPLLGRIFTAEAIRLRYVPSGTPRLPHIRNIIFELPKTVAFAFTFAYKKFLAKTKYPAFFVRNREMTYGLSYHSEQSPFAESQITLLDTTDANGLRRVKIDLKCDRKDAEAIFAAHERLDGWLRKYEIGYLTYRQPKEKTVQAIMELFAHGTHQIGTVPMGECPQEAIVDKNLKCYDFDNLYVCSSATFPMSGQCNPTLSIVAFSCRLADHLAKVID